MKNAPELTRVLIVDDEQTIADILGLILRARGCATRVAYSAEECIAISGQFQPHALITDVLLPGSMNGVELADHFARHHPTCKVLLMSGHVDGMNIAADTAKLSQHRTILPKSFHPQQILDFIAACAPAG